MIRLAHLNEHGTILPKGKPTGVGAPSVSDLFQKLPGYIELLGPLNIENMVWTLGHHNGPDNTVPRSAATFDYQTIIGWDLDDVDLSQIHEYIPIVCCVLKIETKDITYYCTGNGVQCFIHLKVPIRSIQFFKDNKQAYDEICYQITQGFKKKGLPGYADAVIFEPARVFRLPNTINQKKGVRKEAYTIQTAFAELDFDLMVVSGLDKIKRENISPMEIRRNFPRPDFQEIVTECEFMKWALTKPEEIHEPHFFTSVGLLAQMFPSDKIIFEGKEFDSKELSKLIFERAISSDSLSQTNHEDKWEGASRYGAQRCTTIGALKPESCNSCRHKGKLSTPLELKSPNHIGSEPMGYWVMTREGSFKHPNYSDLVKLYKKKSEFVVLNGNRIFNYNCTKYKPLEELALKAWLERTVSPPDPLRELHCNEFLYKAKRIAHVTEETEQEVFDMNVRGRLNCKNGVLDIKTGELIPHSPKYGFLYTLPYDYIPNQMSEAFIDWLGIITAGRIELAECILDVMAYILWPNYDDHLFVFLLGEGANGKSTLLHIIEAMVGKNNCSAMSLQQLCGNRFASANLEGKLVNLSEESSGYSLNLEETNIIKNLSSGGNVAAERKNVQGFEFTNKAKLIFSANKTPSFKERGIAIMRRMVAIPFDYTIEKPDSRIEQALIADVPKIISMLITRIQENIKTNGGRFIVNRGGKVVEETNEKVALSGDSVVEWAKECLDSAAGYPEDDYITVKDAYNNYKKWCDLNNNNKTYTKNNFSSTMYRYVLPKCLDKNSNVIRMNDTVMRVFKKTKFRPEALE